MDPSLLTALEQRTAQAEARLGALEARLADGAAASGSAPAGHVADLEELRKLLLEAKAEREQLLAERDQALEQVAKLQYRVQHLVRSLKEADAAAGRGSSAPGSSAA